MLIFKSPSAGVLDNLAIQRARDGDGIERQDYAVNTPEYPLEKLLELSNALAEGDDAVVRIQLSRLYPTLPISEAIEALEAELWLHAEWTKRQIN